jgi:peptidyl-prolyl cis-trans isomerase-like 4
LSWQEKERILMPLYITLWDDLNYLNEKRIVFGEVVEGSNTLMRINEAYVDEK